MSDIEQPLVLRLLWGGSDIRHNFSLQENETGDIVVSDRPLSIYDGVMFSAWASLAEVKSLNLAIPLCCVLPSKTLYEFSQYVSQVLHF